MASHRCLLRSAVSIAFKNSPEISWISGDRATAFALALARSVPTEDYAEDHGRKASSFDPFGQYGAKYDPLAKVPMSDARNNEKE